MMTGLDFKSAQFDQVRGDTGSKCENLKTNPVRIGGFEMTSHTNKSLLKETPRKNVCACVGHKKDGEECKCQIVNKNMAI